MVRSRRVPEFSLARKARGAKLGTLLEISRLLADTSNLKTAFAAALETLGRHHGIFRGFVMLRDSESDKIRIEASYGLIRIQTHRVLIASARVLSARGSERKACRRTANKSRAAAAQPSSFS